MTDTNKSLNFIEQIVTDDLANGKFKDGILTRFPPEPNGYLHIGHAKSIVLNFGIADEYGGKTNLRFDDTNPTAEKQEYVDAIQRDVNWLGYEWDGDTLFTSDYFPKLHAFAVDLVKQGKAYVDDSTSEEMAAQKGNVTTPGTESPYRNRSVEENLELFENMRLGKYEEGSKVLRAKIDMAHANMTMRDPVIYRIKFAHHHRTGDDWCIYPMYDFAHGLSDAIEGITHSLCTLEFENHRPLYDWFLQELETFPSRQIEFARLNLSYTIMSKRKLKRLVEENYVDGWDDPRMPTLSGMRRRGYPPAALRNFAERVGIAKRENVIDLGFLEFCVREEMNLNADRIMAVLDPLKVVITNYEEAKEEWLPAVNNPTVEDSAKREVPFSREIYIERGDFMEDAPRKFHRLKPEGFVRLRNAYIIQCDEVVKDADGNVVELRCTYFPESKSGQDNSGIKVKGVIHWVSIQHAVKAKALIYDRLFMDEKPDGHEDKDFVDFINPNSKSRIDPIFIEPHIKGAKPLDSFQFLRKGYFCVDHIEEDGQLVINKTIGLRDSWGKSNK